MTTSPGAPSARSERIAGVLSPVLTPFDADLRPDAKRFVRHCRWLLDNDVGLAVFGTNSEANSLGVDERIELLDTLIDSGIDARRLMPGTGCCAFTDTVRLTRHAVARGCAGVLMLPPFYYKGVADEGLYRAFAEVIERVGDRRLNVYLYHIPPVAHVGIGHALIERLLKSYPESIAGIKDSSGDWSNTKAMLERFAPSGFDVFVGSETFLLANMRNGGRGCISATANVNPAAIARLYREWRSDRAEDLQARCDVVRKTFAAYPMIAAMKRAAAHCSDDEAWARVRPPLVELDAADSRKLVGELEAIGFAMEGFGAAETAALLVAT
jgi:4-hydroxy-tetrahydrodipicolinate synthase